MAILLSTKYWISFFLANKKYLIVSCLILLIFITSDNPNHSSIVNHYFLPLVAPMFYALNNYYEKFKNKNYFKKEFMIIYVFLMHIIVSPSPLSFSFYSTVNKYFNYQQYLFSEIKINEKKFIFEKLKKLDKKKIIVASNNANFSYLNSFYNYLPYPAGLEKNFYLPKDISFFEFTQIFLNKESIKVIKLKPDIVIIRKNDKWHYDEKINIQNTHNNEENMHNLENNNFVKHILNDLVIYEKK